MAVLALWLVVGAAIAATVALARGGVRGVAVLGVMALAAAGFAYRPRMPTAPSGMKTTDAGGFLGSGACKSCHPSEYASWTRTYHRTMAQTATIHTVQAALGPPGIDAEGKHYELFARGEEVWVHDGVADSRVLLTTGSHHMQGYWFERARGALAMLPFVYARDEGRAIPRREAFIEPPSMEQPDVRWNSNCIQCHATAGRPEASTNANSFATVVGELGIACEACHGSGETHVLRHHNPFARAMQRAKDSADPTIVNPARLTPERAAAVCGQCHAYAYPKDEAVFWTSGYVDRFRPGDALEPSRTVLSIDVLADPRGPKINADARDLFWSDGTVRVAGREYNAMTLAACFTRGTGHRKLTCLSCHSMHKSDPDDQLASATRVQDACISCHAVKNHSHHPPGSAGDACIACHMPKTSYALRTAIRSHRIDLPRASAPAPNACNLCHLDRSAAWTASKLAEWYDVPMPNVRGDLPASVVGLLSADAAERALWASAMGDPDALRASGADWEGPILEYAADHDPYAAVRFIAARSRALVLREATGSRVVVSDEVIARLAAARDDRPTMVAE